MGNVAVSLWQSQGTPGHILSLSPNKPHIDTVHQFWRTTPIFFPLKETPDRIPHSCHQAFPVLVKGRLKQRLGFIHETQDAGHLSSSLLGPGDFVWAHHIHKHPRFTHAGLFGRIDKVLVVTLRNPHSNSVQVYSFYVYCTYNTLNFTIKSWA